MYRVKITQKDTLEEGVDGCQDSSVQPFLIFFSMEGLRSVKYCYLLFKGIVKKVI